MRTLILALCFLACFVASAPAQECTIAAYADPGGTVSFHHVDEQFSVIPIYVVLFAEDTVAAAAYSLSLPPGLFLQYRNTGPSGTGLFLDEPGGTNAALGECVVGYGGLPVLVDEYVFAFGPDFAPGLVAVGPNTDQDPDLPQYVDCVNLTKDCAPGPGMWLSVGFPTAERSFGAVKSLFH